MSTTVQKQVLINARALIADRGRWTTGMLACTSNGRSVEWQVRSAAKWCALGALYRAAYDLVADREEAIRIGDQLATNMCPPRWLRGGLPTKNDGRDGHTAVLRLFDKALAAA
jgi:hypothetical protein